MTIKQLQTLSGTLNTVSIPHFSQDKVRNCIISLKNLSAGYDNTPANIGKQFT